MNLADLLAEPKQKEDIKPPSMYNVILLNDDYSHAHIVAHILAKHFNKRGNDAYNIMVTAHKEGQAFVGTYPKDVAETKVAKAEAEAHVDEHPLKFKIEKAD